MSHDNRKWVIMTMTAINAGDVNNEDGNYSRNTFISNAIQTSKETLRKTTDGTKAILKWDGDTPSVFDGMTTYTHSEIKAILAGSDWTNSV